MYRRLRRPPLSRVATALQVFSYFVDVMVVEYVGQPDRFKLLPKAKGHAASGADGGVGVTGPSNMIICMEYCDAGEPRPNNGPGQRGAWHT